MVQMAGDFITELCSARVEGLQVRELESYDARLLMPFFRIMKLYLFECV